MVIELPRKQRFTHPFFILCMVGCPSQTAFVTIAFLMVGPSNAFPCLSSAISAFTYRSEMLQYVCLWGWCCMCWKMSNLVTPSVWFFSFTPTYISFVRPTFENGPTYFRYLSNRDGYWRTYFRVTWRAHPKTYFRVTFLSL